MTNDLDTRVRLHIYRSFVDRGSPPTPVETAAALSIPEDEAASAYGRLHDGHVIVLEPDSTDVWMANPICARETGFKVETADRRRYNGTCTWDAPGILAMLDSDGRVSTQCPDCGEPLELVVENGDMRGPDGAVAHFLLPARSWWEDIGFT